MRFISRARIVEDESYSAPLLLGKIEVPDAELHPSTWGVTPAEERDLLCDVPPALEPGQVPNWATKFFVDAMWLRAGLPP